MTAKSIVVMCVECGSDSVVAIWDDPKQVRLLCQGCGVTSSVLKDPVHTNYTTTSDDDGAGMAATSRIWVGPTMVTTIAEAMREADLHVVYEGTEHIGVASSREYVVLALQKRHGKDYGLGQGG